MKLHTLQIEILKEKLIQVQNDIKTNVQVTKRANTTKLEPIDPDKPSTYNGQSFQNTKVTHTQKESDSTATVEDKTTTLQNERTETDINTKDKTKDSESKRGDPWRHFFLPIGIALGVAVILWVIYNRKKSLI